MTAAIWRSGRLLQPGALGLATLAFLLPGLAMPGQLRTFFSIGLPAIAVLGVAPAVFRRAGLPMDRVIHAIVTILAGIGLAFLTRLQLDIPAIGSAAQRQLLGLILGLAAMAGGTILGRVRDRLSLRRYTILLAAFAFLALTIPFGAEAGGARAWLVIGGLHLQPSEFVRPIWIFFLASYLGQHQPLLRAGGPGTLPLWRRSWLLGPVFAAWILALGILLLQRDLGTAILYFAAFLVLLFLASGRWLYLAAGTGLGAAGCLAASLFAAHIRTRILVWLHPLSLAAGAGFQSSRSLFALAAGGLLGAGPGQGYPQSIPAVHTDLIFAAIVEELGLAGGLALLLLYLALIVRGVGLACRSKDRLGYLFGSGLAFTLGLQVLLITGGDVGLLPLTGVTLPLISYGGSSLVSTFFCLGFLNSLPADGRRQSLAD